MLHGTHPWQYFQVQFVLNLAKDELTLLKNKEWRANNWNWLCRKTNSDGRSDWWEEGATNSAAFWRHPSQPGLGEHIATLYSVKLYLEAPQQSLTETIQTNGIKNQPQNNRFFPPLVCFPLLHNRVGLLFDLQQQCPYCGSVLHGTEVFIGGLTEEFIFFQTLLELNRCVSTI